MKKILPEGTYKEIVSDLSRKNCPTDFEEDDVSRTTPNTRKKSTKNFDKLLFTQFNEP